MAKMGIQVCDIEMFHSVMLAGKDNQHTRLVHLLYLLYLQKRRQCKRADNAAKDLKRHRLGTCSTAANYISSSDNINLLKTQ